MKIGLYTLAYSIYKIHTTYIGRKLIFRYLWQTTSMLHEKRSVYSISLQSKSSPAITTRRRQQLRTEAIPIQQVVEECSYFTGIYWYTDFLTLSPIDATVSMACCTCRQTSWTACSRSLKLFFSSCNSNIKCISIKKKKLFLQSNKKLKLYFIISTYSITK